jgi:hypothetical protein
MAACKDVSHFIHSSPGRDTRACDEGHRRREDTELNMECRAAREVRPMSASFAGQHNANVCAMAQISIPKSPMLICCGVAGDQLQVNSHGST